MAGAEVGAVVTVISALPLGVSPGLVDALDVGEGGTERRSKDDSMFWARAAWRRLVLSAEMKTSGGAGGKHAADSPGS